MKHFHIKTNRVFTPIRKYGWIFTLSVAFGGLWYPKIGLLVIGVILALSTLSFFKGRYWCGNFCPHGSLFDSLLLPVSRNTNIPKFFGSKLFNLVFFSFFAWNMSRKLIKVSGIWGETPFWDKLGFIFVTTYLMVTVVGGLINVFFAPRTWCQFCPMGIIQRFSYRLGKLLGVAKNTDEKITISSIDKCHSCGKCSRVCPMQLTPYLEFSEENQFDSSKCIRCSTCVENCPAGILSLDKEKDAIAIKENTSNDGYDDRKKITAQVEKIRNLGNDINEYTFKFIKPKKVDYKAGQFILVKIQNEPEMYRAYSISSFNEDGTRVSVTIKRMETGYGTNIIFNGFKEGDIVELEGPMGNELIVDKSQDKVLLVGGGIGITPFLPIVRDLTENKNNVKEIKLVYGVNTPKEFIYNEEFTSLDTKNTKFDYLQVVAFDESWKGHKGFVTDVIKDMDLTGYKVYMCGPKPMTNATVKLLEKMNVQKENIFEESA